MCISNPPLAESSKIMADCSDVTVFVTPEKYCDSKYIFILCYRKGSNYEQNKTKQNKTAQTQNIRNSQDGGSLVLLETWQQTFLIFIIYVRGQEHLQHILLHLLTLQSVGRKWPIRKLLGKISVGEGTDQITQCLQFDQYQNMAKAPILKHIAHLIFIVFSPVRALRICFALSSAVALLWCHRLILDI